MKSVFLSSPLPAAPWHSRTANFKRAAFTTTCLATLLTPAVYMHGHVLDPMERIAVSGEADLGGVLNVDLLSGFTPILGDFFDIITAQNVIGDFESLFLPVLGNGLALEGINGGSFYRLQIVAAPVPIPSMIPIFVAALIGLGLRRRAR